MGDSIRLKRGKQSDWNRINPILNKAEIGIVFSDDTNVLNPIGFKIGNGLEAFSSLPLFKFNLKTSDLENDGDDGSSPFATQQWVLDHEIEGLLDTISINEGPRLFPDSEKNINLPIDKTTVGLSNVENLSPADLPISTATHTALDAINVLIPSDATAQNPLTSHDTVVDMINSLAAYQITYNAAGDAFPTRAALIGASVFYSGGVVRIPTQNDYAYVLNDENHDNSTTRYSYQGGTYPNGAWAFQIVVNETPLTQEQLNAVNSGITTEKVSSYDSHIADKNNPHEVTKTQVGLGNVDNTSDANKPISTATQTALNNKQDKIDSSHKLLSDFVDDTNQTNQFVTAGEKTAIANSVQRITIAKSMTLDQYLAAYENGRLYVTHMGSDDWFVSVRTAYDGTYYSIEIESAINTLRYEAINHRNIGSLTFNDIMTPTYQNDYALQSDLRTGLAGKQDAVPTITITQSMITGYGGWDYPGTTPSNDWVRFNIGQANQYLISDNYDTIKLDIRQIKAALNLPTDYVWIKRNATNSQDVNGTTITLYQFFASYDGFEYEGLLDPTNPYVAILQNGSAGFIYNSDYGLAWLTFRNFNITDIYSRISVLETGKQNKLTFDSTPTAGSNNPVTSAGIKTAIDTAISSVYRFKGSVATYADLPSTELTVGDVYNVLDTDRNYAWTGSTWDALGGTVDLSNYVPTSRTIAGNALTGDISAQTLTDSLVYMNATTDLDDIFAD